LSLVINVTMPVGQYCEILAGVVFFGLLPVSGTFRGGGQGAEADAPVALARSVGGWRAAEKLVRPSGKL
jgi:hypothetical protein